MPVEITVDEPSCRGCELCIDVCPTRVFELDPERRLCLVRHAEDCIACLSCAYLCPSDALEHRGCHEVKNFYRDQAFCSKMEKFL